MTRPMKPSCCATLPRFLRISSLLGSGVGVHKFADIAGLGKDIGGVARLRDFGDDHAWQLEDVFVAEADAHERVLWRHSTRRIVDTSGEPRQWIPERLKAP